MTLYKYVEVISNKEGNLNHRMVGPLSIQNIQVTSRNVSNTISKQHSEAAYPVMKELPNYPISFCSAQIQQHSKGSTPYVAKQLKALGGTLGEKIPKAKDIILKDMALPSDLVECVDRDLGGSGYAAYFMPLGKIVFDKKYCDRPDSEFSDEAIMCILRHELDHMEVFAKLYKKLGKEEFTKTVSGMLEKFPEGMRDINYEFYEEMSKHVNIDNFDADKYVYAIKNYYSGANLNDTPYKKFTGITKNFDNALEDSARDKQYELEDLMGVTTLKDFYSMIDETKKLSSEIRAKGVSDENEVQEMFDDLYTRALQSTGLEDKIQNWGKIIKEAQVLNNQ